MEVNMNKTLTRNMAIAFALASFYFCAYSASDANVTNPTPLKIQGKSERSLNRRLSAIANDPGFLKRLDQKGNFRTDQAYLNILNASLAAAKRRLPDVFSITNLEHAITAVCLADSKVFFWIPTDESVIVGWMPLLQKDKPDNAREDVVLWLVPTTTHKTKLSEVWQNRQAALARGTWLQDVLKTGLNVTLKNGVSENKNTPTLRGSVMEHDFEATATENLVQVRASLRTTNETNFPGKPVMTENDLNDMPTVLPFWPPKED